VATLQQEEWVFRKNDNVRHPNQHFQLHGSAEFASLMRGCDIKIAEKDRKNGEDLWRTELELSTACG
jgi:hypothetical protein